MSPPAAALRVLVGELVDYAGLFPPAALPMAGAVGAYASYLESAEAWMLGRFVVPAARLHELEAMALPLVEAQGRAWRLSVLLGDDLARDMALVVAFGARNRSRLVVDAVETPATTPEAIERLARLLPRGVDGYVELRADPDPRRMIEAVRRHGLRAKLRTGGVVPAAFPTAEQVARFITRCAEAGVAFKATAGLHHPLRAEYRLTYEADAPRGTMFGFLNVFLAAALARGGADEAIIARMLEERDPAALRFTDGAVHWRDHVVPLADLRAARGAGGIAFGSCSFREPVDDLHHLGLL